MQVGHSLTKMLITFLIKNFYADQSWLFVCSSGFISQAAKAGMLGLPGCRTFSLEEVVDITRNFDKSALLGEGSYGKVLFQIQNLLYSYAHSDVDLM